MNIKKASLISIAIAFIMVLCLWLILIEDSRQFLASTHPDKCVVDYGEYARYIDINDIVTEAFITNAGYTNELSRYMTEDVFKHMNYKQYNVNASQYTKPLDVDFKIKEIYQTKDEENHLIYVDMIYTIVITDSKGLMVGGSWDTKVTFTVRLDEKGWYIIKKYESP
ncbi:hypothetical protein [Anaerosinus massiliensis]|uniref:hypothetical protein n=1 Tax=Massilibacillus massiliensis TaxID=1806837 RepID=UPI000DA61B5F|nr:hypothetical protein [Massilibacillus massiliensis]